MVYSLWTDTRSGLFLKGSNTLNIRTELAGGRPRRSVDRSGGSACLDAAEDRLAAVSAMGSTTGSFRGLLPVIVEGD